jgi:hypothetical protein
MRTKRFTQIFTILIAAYGPIQLHADDCFTMLAPVFNNAKTTGYVVPGRTFATVTKHYASLNTSGAPDTVRYAFGALVYSQLWWPASGWTDTVSGSINTYRQNTTTSVNMDMFAPSYPALSLSFMVNTYGMVSIQELLSGHPIGGAPPAVLQGTCSGGLVTVTNIYPYNNTAWVFTLSTTPPGSGPH